MFASGWTEIDDPISFADGFIIMFDDQNCVAQVAQTFERFQQSCVVTWMQTNRRFIQHIQHANQTRADLSCQTNALRFSAR